ncbi:sec1 family domain containing Slh [Dermatophagoides pteronyssinus]|nr:sec1 family domain-containing protein 1-like [Dermatophagoides pteronyssinus]
MISSIASSSSSSNLNALTSSSGNFSITGNESESTLNIREKQKDALKKMLNLNTPLPMNSTANEPVWKLFIYDRYGQDIVSPLMNIKELREFGVTLHMQLHSDREPIPDVPAVYFVMPNDENIMRICQDFRNHLYDHYHLNFISPISRAKLEELATAALQANCVTNISKIYDQYLNFISLEDDVFILRHSDKDKISFYAINRPANQEPEIESIMDQIVDSLFSFFVTLGVVPIIRTPKGNAAEMVGEKLDKRIRENLRDTKNTVFNGSDIQRLGVSSLSLMFTRPLLIILDRSFDMATPLLHSWTYQSLIHDVLDFKLNQVFIDESNSSNSNDNQKVMKKSKMTAYDLSSQDKFWNQHKCSPFPQVAESIQEKLDSYRSSEEEVKRLKSEMGLDGNIPDSAISLLTDNTHKLNSAINTLPNLLETKRIIDLHTTVASAILEYIKNRKLDVFFEIEEKIIASKGHLDQKSASTPLELIRDPNAGTPEDKMRLFIIYYLHHNFTDAEFEQYAVELRNVGCDLSPIEYVKRCKFLANPASSPVSSSNQNVDSIFQSLGGGTKTVNMFSKLMSQGSQFVMEGVKNLVVKKHTLPITRVTDALMEAKSTPETDEFRYFDPKVLAKAQNLYGEDGGTFGSSSSPSKNPFQDAIVFVVGGGNYIEYQNLVDYCKTKSKSSPKRIIYGSTEISNAQRFLSQLKKLTNEMI